jgi:prepilin-type N-terminal cleavage/methylation domain-containing protein
VAERGFSLVETMTAMVLLSLGLLALGASAAAALRTTTEADHIARAALAASARLELMMASACPEPGMGELRVGPYQVSWVAAGDSLRSLSAAVTYSLPRGQRTDAYRTAVYCPSP